tara:strand:+ start:2893 stop:4890 length:1998 start_codon:yes stop_codon:yes gene_type:complete
MSNFLSNYYKTIDVEKELEKILPADEKTIDTEKVENQDLSIIEQSLDPLLSVSNKFVGSAVQILDLPFMLLDAVDTGKDFVFKKMATASGMSEADQNEIIEKSKLPVDITEFRPGKFINDNFLNDAANYEAKTTVGKFTGTMGEYMPFGLLAKTPKAKTVLMGTGGASGLIDETATQTLQSEGIGTGVGVASNVILDLLALKKGNLAGVIENVIPDAQTIKNAKKIQKDAKEYGLNITTGEATESASILKLEGSTNANIIGNKVLDAHWKNRPLELKNYITNWGKANGLLPDSGKITSSSINEQVKKVALQLDQQRSKMWLKSGGATFNKSFFDSQSVDNVKIALLKVAENAPDDIAKYLTRQANAIGKSNGSGAKINKIYQDLRDGGIQSAKNENFTSAKSYEEAKNVLKELLVTNKDWVKANKKYKVFSETFEKPLSKGSVTELFNDLKKGKWIESSKTNANIYKYITSPNVRPIDIQKLATAVNKSGVKGAWENIASDFFNNAFNKAAIDNMNRGLNTGNNFYNAILKTPRNKENFTEVMYQLALTTNKNVKKSDVQKAVTSFANVLKASGAGGKVGSTTATNIGAKEQLSKTPLDVLEGFALTGIKKWFGERAYSKSSTEIAEALVSQKGIDAFIDLAQNWKNKNKAVSLLRALTIATDEE